MIADFFDAPPGSRALCWKDGRPPDTGGDAGGPGMIPLHTVLSRLQRSCEAPDAPADADLLERFVLLRDESSFAALVGRHGPMVWGLCRRRLPAEDAEDAFQATFLVLARRGGSIGRRQSLAAWLYTVAVRVANRACARAARRPAGSLESEPPAPPPPVPLPADERAILDEEVGLLPERYRAAVVLCCLQGRSSGEAAAELGCPRGTVDSRLAWARKRLRARLLRRGVVPAAGGAALLAAEAPAGVPPTLINAAVRTAAAAGSVPEHVLHLTRGVNPPMLSKFKLAAALSLTVGLIGAGAGLLRQPVQAEAQKPTPPAGKPPAPPPPPGGETPPPTPEDKPTARAVPNPPSLVALRKRMAATVLIDQEQRMSLGSVLDFLGDRYAVPFLVDGSLTEVGAQQRGEGAVAVRQQDVMLQKTPPVPLSVVLQNVLSQAQVPGGRLTYRVKDGHVAIVVARPAARMLEEPVRVEAENDRLSAVLDRLVADTGANIVQDPRAKEQLATPVNLSLQDVPLESAVRVLSDTAGLRVAVVDNILYVTTPENAERMKKEKTH
jgi:RNA polymerase sigma factor (sigma-70 family)